MTGSQFTALILGGSRAGDDPVAKADGKSCKAFVEIAGKPMIEHVVDVVEASGRVGCTLVCLDPDAPVGREAPDLAAHFASGRIERVDAEDGPSLSALRVVDSLAEGAPLFITTADHPLLRPDHIRDFLDAAAASGAAAVAGLTPTAVVQAAYPRNRRTRLGFRDGTYSGCNLFAFSGSGVREAVLYWRSIEKYRKRPLRLAARIGPRILINHLLGRLTLGDAVAYLEDRSGVSMRTVVLEDADAATDVDSPEDLKLVRSIFERKVVL